MSRPLRFLAGPEAMARIRAEGFQEDLFDVVAGASGGPKWLALTRLDRALFGGWFRTRTRPLHLVGSSIGCWRFACIAQPDPVAACARFEDTYLDYEVEAPVTPAALTEHCRGFLEVILGRTGAADILTHPCMRLSVLAVRGRGMRDHPVSMGLGLAAAALANTASRRSLHLFFERTCIQDPRSAPPFAPGFAARAVPLTAANMEAALLATAAVPFVFAAVPQLEGGPPGLYLDGGILDYHLDIPYQPPGLVLYPHFSERIVPGWFDKSLRWRRPDPRNLARTLLICPSRDFIAGLPHGRIPERSDFKRLPTAARKTAWRRAVAETDRLVDCFLEAVERQRVPDLLEPLC